MVTRKIIAQKALPHWKAATAELKRQCVTLVSPYVSRSTVQMILDSRPQTAELLTTFSASNFAMGASDLTALRQLVESGVRVHSVPDLHAKIFLSARLATIGSQNMTQGGTRNIEATALFRSPQNIARISRMVADWRRVAQLVTLERIEAMERDIVGLKELFSKASEAARKVDAAIIHADTCPKRVQLSSPNEPASKTHEDWLKGVRTSLAKGLVSQSVRVDARVTQRESSRGRYTTLARIRSDDSFTRWYFDAGLVRLKRRARHLLYYEDSGALSWPAMNDSQLTQFATRLTVTRDLSSKLRSQIQVQFVQDPEALESHNVTIAVRRIKAALSASVKARWAPDQKLQFVGDLEREEKDDASNADEVGLGELMNWVKKHSEAFRLLVTSLLEKSFRFDRNKFGRTAAILGPLKSRVRIRLGRRAGKNRFVLLAKLLGPAG
ncbi:MAG: hypothetical protein Q8S73_23355 [Deltaproteobacteria bacterium]|nr:hypothetical protein [Myxococcales bacterium]MDP3217068.1 hypothetical protein [Deltaproteobacteria bacterium]